MSIETRPLAMTPFTVASVLCACLAGCAGNPIRAQWTDPAFPKGSLKGASVLVVCDAGVLALRRICEQEAAQQLAAAGITPRRRPGSQDAGSPGAAADPAILGAAREAGAAALFRASIRPDTTVAKPPPTIGIGIGSWGGWSGGVGGSVGVSMPVGSSTLATAYGAEMTLTDAASGKLIWTSTATGQASSNDAAQIAGLIKAGVNAARGAGLF